MEGRLERGEGNREQERVESGKKEREREVEGGRSRIVIIRIINIIIRRLIIIMES